MSDNNPTFDIVIAGGGLSGLLMAQSLANLTTNDGKPLSIAIVEATATNTDISLTFDDRVLALAHGTASYLDGLGAWQALKSDATAISHIHISDRGHYGKARIDAKEHQVDALGYVIEMSLIGQALYKLVIEHQHIQWFCPDSIEQIEWQQSQVNITLSSNQQISASLLLACDGGQSVCRQKAGINKHFSDYQQSAVIANVKTEHAHNEVAFERFTETGPIAMLPLSQGRCSLVWSLTPEQAEETMQLSEQEFAKKLNQDFGNWLGKITEVGQRFCYPLVLVQAEQQVYHRMALVGNASHTIHPIAGQGFNLGVRDVQLLAKLIEQALSQDKPIGQFALLAEYEQQRLIDQNQVITLTDSLVTLFSNDLMPIIAGRNIGLKVMNYCSSLQQRFVEKTMGYR